jgi:hypothetical protein
MCTFPLQGPEPRGTLNERGTSARRSVMTHRGREAMTA